MRQQLETSPDEENSRSAVLLRFPCGQSRAGVSAGLAKELSGFVKEYDVKCENGSMSARIVSATQTTPRQFVEQHKDGGPRCSVNRFFARCSYNHCPPTQVGGSSRCWTSLCASLVSPQCPITRGVRGQCRQCPVHRRTFSDSS